MPGTQASKKEDMKVINGWEETVDGNPPSAS